MQFDRKSGSLSVLCVHGPGTVVKYIDPRKEALRVFRYILVRHFGKAPLSRVFQRTGRYGWNLAV